MSLLRRPGVRRAVLGCGLVLCVAVEHAVMRGTDHPASGGWWAAVGVLVVAVALLIRARLPEAALALAFALIGGTSVLNDGWNLTTYVAFGAALSFLIGRWADGVRSTTAVVVASLAALLLLDALVNDPSWSGWLGRGAALIGNTILFMGLPWLSGRYLRQVASHHAAAVEHAQLRERARIAQEMHDSLGHELSLIALRAGALEVRSGIPDDVRHAAAALRSAAADATDRLGQIVGVLRPGEEEVPLEPAAASIAELVERARDSGLDVRFEGATDTLAPLQQVAAHRVVQEGLTNAARHAPGAPVTVRLERGRQAVHVFVLNGAARDRPRHGITSRLGLAGLDEAARAAGGSLRHGPTGDGGFALVAELPVPERARRSAAEATS